MILSSGTFAPGDADADKLFKEQPYESGPTHPDCSVCGSELTNPIAKMQPGKYAHENCLHDAVETGLYPTYTILSIERENGLAELSLVKDHPSVNRCVVCGGTWGREEQIGDTLAVYSPRPSAAFAHKVCVANAIYQRELTAQKISEIAHDTKLPLQKLFPQALQRCFYCTSPLGEDPLITHSGALAHRNCVKHLYQSGQLNEIQIADVVSMNSVSREALGESPRHRFEKRSFLGAAVAEAQGVIAKIWNTFVQGIKSLMTSFQGTASTYDQAIAQAEGILQAAGGKRAALTLGNIRAEWLSSTDTHDILAILSKKGGSLNFLEVSDFLHKAVGARPSKIAAFYVTSEGDCREVMIPKTASRQQMMQKLGIAPDLERAMEMLAALQVAEDQHKAALDEIKLQFGILNMDRDTKMVEAVLLKHLQALESKQSKYKGILYQISQATRRTTTSYPPVMEGIFSLVAADKKLTEQIGLLLRKFTTASYYYDKVRVVVKEIPSQVREQLQEIEIPVGEPEQPSSPEVHNPDMSKVVEPK